MCGSVPLAAPLPSTHLGGAVDLEQGKLTSKEFEQVVAGQASALKDIGEIPKKLVEKVAKFVANPKQAGREAYAALSKRYERATAAGGTSLGTLAVITSFLPVAGQVLDFLEATDDKDPKAATGKGTGIVLSAFLGAAANELTPTLRKLLGEGEGEAAPAVVTTAPKPPLTPDEAFKLIDRFRGKAGMQQLGTRVPVPGDKLGTVALVEGTEGKPNTFGVNSRVLSNESKEPGDSHFPI